jgi:drug/metabolite transporter (DMT)-like permease
MYALPPYAKGFAMTLAGVFVLCPDALLIRLIQADGWTVVFYRGLLTALTLTAFLAVRYRRGLPGLIRRIDAAAVLSGLLYGVGNLCFVLSINKTLVANTLIILAATPLVTALFSRVFLGERQRRATWGAILAILAGVAALFAGDVGGGHFVGNLLAVVSATVMAGNLTALRRSRVETPVPSVVIGGLFAAAAALPFAAPMAIDGRDFGLLLILGLAILPVSFGLIFAGPRYLPAPEVALILLTQTLLGPFFVWLALGEVPGSRVLLAGGFIVCTVAFHAAGTLKAARKKPGGPGVGPGIK